MTTPTLDTTHVRRWKRYAEYRPISHRWLSEMPTTWTTKRISWLFQLMGSGTTPTTSDESYFGGDIPWINTGDLNDGVIDETPKKIRPKALTEHSALKVYPTGTLLIALYGATIGKVGITANPATTNQACFAMAKPKGVDVAFLRYWFLGNREHIVAMSYGGGQPNISGELVRRLRVTLPPLPEQRAIAAFLDRETARIDALIAQKERLIELLEEKRQAVISHAVTRGLDPSVPLKDSGVPWLGMVPKHWTVMPFKRTAFFQEGPGLRQWQFTDSGVRVICVTNITESGIDFSAYEKYISRDEYERTYRHFTVSKGDLLLSSSGNSWGKVAEYKAQEPVILNTSTIRINENATKTLHRSLIKWGLQSETTREQLGIMMTGSCQPNFGPTHLSRVVLPIPPVPEQLRIAAYLDKATLGFSDLKSKIQSGIARLQEYRTALISAAVTGQIDVRDEVATA